MVGTRKNGTLTYLADAENTLDSDHELLVPEPTLVEDSNQEGRHHGKRQRRANRHYLEFWRHYDEDNVNSEHME